ncbi:DUF1269 domain-containing protein [Microlunatus ginsengisoli]|uniref:DUF1269 domain-containing protein n=1 Tax=Microlunatus ginsengisoli TaxID=363863 RepID=A0ABP7AKQ8_9ACTN
MGKASETRHLYVAAYSDPATAAEDWDALKRLAADDVIRVEALALVTRDADGKIHVEDTTNEPGVAAAVGADAGTLVGLIFPPSLIATATVGAVVGAGSGAVVDRVTKREVGAGVEWIVPVGGSGIALIFDDQWVNEVERCLLRADEISRNHLHAVVAHAQADPALASP